MANNRAHPESRRRSCWTSPGSQSARTSVDGVRGPADDDRRRSGRRCACAHGSGGDSTSTTKSPSRTVDAAQVESGIDKQLSTPAAEVSNVKCPDDVQAEAGATFKCSVAWSNGATGKVKVTQESLNQFTYEPVSGSVRVPGSTVEKSIEQELDKTA